MLGSRGSCTCTSIGEETIWTVDRVGNLGGDWLMERDCGMTLDGRALGVLLLSIHAIKLFSLVCFSISHHHLLLLTKMLHVGAFSMLAFTEFEFAHVPFTHVSELPFAAVIRGGMLRQGVSNGAELVTLGLWGRGLSVVLVTLLMTWRALSQIGDGQAMACWRLRMMLMIGRRWRREDVLGLGRPTGTARK